MGDYSHLRDPLLAELIERFGVEEGLRRYQNNEDLPNAPLPVTAEGEPGMSEAPQDCLLRHH